MIFAAMYGDDFLSYVIYLIFTLIAVCIAMVCHEVAHGLVAKWNGDPTAKMAGRLTLNPLKHFDLIGFIMMMLVGFGYAKPVPVNPYNFKHYRRGLFTVAIAGVITNLIIAFISSLFAALLMMGWSRATTESAANVFITFSRLFEIITTINLSLFFFNILPIYPLDGFRVVETFTHQGNKYCAFMRKNGQYIIWALVALSFLISMIESYADMPFWFSFIDILGTYLNFTAGYVDFGFSLFWSLII